MGRNINEVVPFNTTRKSNQKMLVQCVLQKFISNEFGPTAYEQSRKAATQKRAAIDIDDDGHQNKKQKYTFKGVIPTTNDPIQCR